MRYRFLFGFDQTSPYGTSGCYLTLFMFNLTQWAYTLVLQRQWCSLFHQSWKSITPNHAHHGARHAHHGHQICWNWGTPIVRRGREVHQIQGSWSLAVVLSLVLTQNSLYGIEYSMFRFSIIDPAFFPNAIAFQWDFPRDSSSPGTASVASSSQCRCISCCIASEPPGNSEY